MKIKIYKIIVLLFLTSYGALSMAKTNVVASNFSAPTGIAFNSSGDMFVTNWSGNSITKVSPSGQREIFYSGIASPAGIVIDTDNNLYVSSYSGDYILLINERGEGSRISEGYHTPTGIALSRTGMLLVTNRSTGEIISLNLKTGAKQIVANGLSTPVGVTELPDGSLVVSQYSGRLTLISSNGSKKELGADFDRPGVGIITESSDTVIVIDNGAGAVRRVNVVTGKTDLIARELSGAVALTSDNNRLYVGVWSDGSVRILN